MATDQMELRRFLLIHGPWFAKLLGFMRTNNRSIVNPSVLFMCCALAGGGALLAAPRPNIILCMADDMGWGDPGYNSRTVTFADGSPHPDQGWIRTPTMDRMAANGLRFDRFYSASAVCSPTRASCLTGRNPFRVGVPTANAGRLGFDETPLSEVLSAAGYRCGHFGKWHLGSMTTLRSDSNRGGKANVYSGPWHHDYDVCFATESKVPTYHPYRKSTNGLGLPSSFADPNFYGTRYWRMPATWNENSGEGEVVRVEDINDAENGDDSKLIVDEVIPFMQDSVAEGKPFFAVIWFHTPHKPVVDPEGVEGVDSSDAGKDSIEDLDAAIGRVREALTTLGVRRNTMFWVTSDNGPENGIDSFNESSTVRSIRSGRLLERKRSLHEGGVRVPGILEWPDVISSGMTTTIPAVTTDYYPTILDYLCLSVPNQKPLDGITLRPIIEGTATTRGKPIGFKFGGDKSWVNQRYKLIDDGGGWELYDLENVAEGEELEQTPLATADTIGSQPAELQELYNTMLAEFSAWNTAVGNDTPYVHSSQPTASLSTPAKGVGEPFVVTATFSEEVSELHAGEFVVTNGVASDLGGGGTTWTVTITPDASGKVTVELPEGAVLDSDGNINAASTLVVPSPPSAGDGELVETVLALGGGQTVDRANLVPANGSNNLAKFTAGAGNDGVENPYTTTMYVRSSSSEAARTVRALVRFDLSTLPSLPVAKATLSFHAHSLNDQNPVTLRAVALAADWREVGAPLPTFNHAVVGNMIDGGDISMGLDPLDHTRDYELDVTPAVRNWLNGAWPNNGLQLLLTPTESNNGIGIQMDGGGALQLKIEQTPLTILDFQRGPGPDDVTLEWNSVPDARYRIEADEDLRGDWDLVGMATGSVGETTHFTDLGGLLGFSSRFYRIALLTP